MPGVRPAPPGKWPAGRAVLLRQLRAFPALGAGGGRLSGPQPWTVPKLPSAGQGDKGRGISPVPMPGSRGVLAGAGKPSGKRVVLPQGHGAAGKAGWGADAPAAQREEKAAIAPPAGGRMVLFCLIQPARLPRRGLPAWRDRSRGPLPLCGAGFLQTVKAAIK